MFAIAALAPEKGGSNFNSVKATCFSLISILLLKDNLNSPWPCRTILKWQENYACFHSFEQYFIPIMIL